MIDFTGRTVSLGVISYAGSNPLVNTLSNLFPGLVLINTIGIENYYQSQTFDEFNQLLETFNLTDFGDGNYQISIIFASETRSYISPIFQVETFNSGTVVLTSDIDPLDYFDIYLYINVVDMSSSSSSSSSSSTPTPTTTIVPEPPSLPNFTTVRTSTIVFVMPRPPASLSGSLNFGINTTTTTTIIRTSTTTNIPDFTTVKCPPKSCNILGF